MQFSFPPDSPAGLKFKPAGPFVSLNSNTLDFCRGSVTATRRPRGSELKPPPDGFLRIAPEPFDIESWLTDPPFKSDIINFVHIQVRSGH